MTDEMILWHAFRAAAQAYMTDKGSAAAERRLAAYTNWVRSCAPGDADTLIAEERTRLEAACAA